MIYDRTQSDIDAAEEALAAVQRGEPLTAQIIAALIKGTLNISVMNRIESKEDELSGLFAADYYFSDYIQTKSWTYYDYFKPSDFDRILDNLQKLRQAYFTHTSTPEIPDRNYFRYQTINAVEYMLNDLDIMINEIKSYYRECGAYECGEEEQND